MDAAENTALSDDGDTVDQEYSYYNAKDMVEIPPYEMPPTEAPMEISELEEYNNQGQTHIPPREILLIDNKKFGGPVNTTLSSVIPYTNVYDRGKKANASFT